MGTTSSSIIGVVGCGVDLKAEIPQKNAAKTEQKVITDIKAIIIHFRRLEISNLGDSCMIVDATPDFTPDDVTRLTSEETLFITFIMLSDRVRNSEGI